MALFLIFGYTQTGSGTLTFPEDFEIMGYTTSEDEARDKCNELNLEVYEDFVSDEDDDEEEFGTQEWTDMVFEKLSGESVTLYEYMSVDKI
jgi:hypothetical protein